MALKNRISKHETHKTHRNFAENLNSTSETQVLPKKVALKNRKSKKKSDKVCSLSDLQKEVPKMELQNFALGYLKTNLTFQETIEKDYVYHDFVSEDFEAEFKVPHLHNNGYMYHFNKMTPLPSLATQIFDGVISTMDIHKSQEKIIICAGNVNGKIILMYGNSYFDHCIFRPHLDSINNMKFHPDFPNLLISSSLDGTVRCADFEKKIFHQVFEDENCVYFDFLSPTSYLVAHRLNNVSIVDLRCHGETFPKSYNCSEDIIKTVDVHPVHKNFFVSSHEKGNVKLWDIRKLQDEPVINIDCGGQMRSAFFCPITGNSILLTQVDKIRLLDTASFRKKCKRSITYEVLSTSDGACATWLPNTDDTFVIGRLSSRIEIFDDHLYNIFNFTDDSLINCAAEVNVFHPSLPFLAYATPRKIRIFSEIE